MGQKPFFHVLQRTPCAITSGWIPPTALLLCSFSPLAQARIQTQSLCSRGRCDDRRAKQPYIHSLKRYVVFFSNIVEPMSREKVLSHCCQLRTSYERPSAAAKIVGLCGSRMSDVVKAMMNNHLRGGCWTLLSRGVLYICNTHHKIHRYY
jgi:hypothetical protein